MFGKIVKLLLLGLVLFGVIRGFINYSNATGDNVIARAGSAIVNTAADLTYQWIPHVVGFFESIFA